MVYRITATLLAITFLLSPFTPVNAAIGIEDGMLVRADGTTRIYYIDHGVKRWVNAPETLRLQGLADKPVAIVSVLSLATIPEGERLTADSQIIVPGEESILPDLTPFPAYNLYLTTLNGRTILKFGADFLNQGNGPLELLADPADTGADGYQDTYQHIIRPDGSVRNKGVGTFLWHPAHAHFHFTDFADYTLELVRPRDGNQVIPPAYTQKTTFCMRDNVATGVNPTKPVGPRTFVNCGQTRQGVSAGWSDVYPASLPDMYIDVHDLPPGQYRAAFNVDPRHHFVETRTDNNISYVVLDLDVAARTVKVIASASPFVTSRNSFQDGLVVKGAEKPGVYVMEKNQKRLLLSEEAFLATGHDWDDIEVFPQTIVDAIPSALVRSAGTSAVYAFNDEGYLRHILSPEILSSYGFETADVIDLDPTVFASYPVSSLVARPGIDRVFSTTESRFVGTFAEVLAAGMDPRSVHAINETEMKAHSVSVFASGLDVPWDLAFLPDGDMLVTERPGTLRRLGEHAMSIHIPDASEYGEGGLMGIALHPDFAANPFAYIYYTSTDGKNRIVRYRITDTAMTFDKQIIGGIPSAIYHDGGQVAFGPDGMLYATTGDSNNESLAPNLSSLAGKTLRLTPDGAIPSDNPFGTAVWSFGHRNAQGLAWDSQGRLWETEHGRSGATTGFDELNLVTKGGNYGWPNSQGSTVVPGTTGPVLHSGATTTWAPSGIASVGDRLFFAGLRGASLYAATIDANGIVTRFDTYLTDQYGRLRGVVLGPDGMLYVTTSNRDGRGTVLSGDDKILKINPEFFK